MRQRRRRRAEDLRRAIDCLPRGTRVAMVDALEDTRIIAGAYTDGLGGICPMLAAHRNGGRTNLASFARAWDAYTGATGMREASERELRTLSAMLEASLYYEERADELSDDMAAAAAKARELAGERDERAAHGRGRRLDGGAGHHGWADTGERDRTHELRHRRGWAWLRVFRRLDEYEDAVARAHGHDDARGQDTAPERERELV